MLRLIRTGSYHATMRADLPPVTLPNHTCLATGLSIQSHGVTLNMNVPGRIDQTTIFDVAKKAEMCVGFFVSKNKLGYLCEEHAVDAWRKAESVEEVTQVACDSIARLDMNLIFVHFGEPDGTGHRSGWMTEDYFASVRAVDAGIARILDALKAKDRLKDTVVIVTADHGGHDKTHYLDAPCDRNVPFIIHGPGIAVGRTLHGDRMVMDVPATALELLGLPIESAADGEPVREAYASFVEVETPAEPAPERGIPGYAWFLLAAPAVVFIIWRFRRTS